MAAVELNKSVDPPGKPIERRIVIVGCPRSGTSVLQCLLATKKGLATFQKLFLSKLRMKTKPINALRYGRPLVATPAGTLEIKGNRHSSACFVGNEADSLTEHCLLPLRDPQKRRSLASEAICLVNNYNQRNYQALKVALGYQ